MCALHRSSRRPCCRTFRSPRRLSAHLLRVATWRLRRTVSRSAGSWRRTLACGVRRVVWFDCLVGSYSVNTSRRASETAAAIATVTVSLRGTWKFPPESGSGCAFLEAPVGKQARRLRQLDSEHHCHCTAASTQAHIYSHTPPPSRHRDPQTSPSMALIFGRKGRRAQYVHTSTLRSSYDHFGS